MATMSHTILCDQGLDEERVHILSDRHDGNIDNLLDRRGRNNIVAPG